MKRASVDALAPLIFLNQDSSSGKICFITYNQSKVRRNSVRCLEPIKWGSVFLLFFLAAAGNHFYHDITQSLRIFTVTILVLAGICTALITDKGKTVLSFSREAKIEARKVFWPTYQETFYTTMVVAVVITVMSLVLWGLDNLLVRLVSFITCLRF